MSLTKEEEKLILKRKVQILRWDLSTYMSVKATIKAIDEVIYRLESYSMDSAPAIDEIVGGKVTGGKATEFDSAVEALSIRVADYQSEKGKFQKIINRIDNVLGKLDSVDRLMIESFFFKGSTHAMIGSMLGYTSEGARSRIRRILQKMSEIY